MILKRASLKAVAVLEELSIDKNNIDVYSIAEKANLKVFEAALPEQVSGIYEPQRKEIYIKQSDSVNRKRFTIAHELGHHF